MEDIDMVKNSFQKVDTLAKYRRIYCQGQGNRGRGRNQENLQEEVDKENCDWKNVGEKEFVENVSNVGEIKGKEWSDRSRAKELSQENYINQQASSLMLRLDTANKSQR